MKDKKFTIGTDPEFFFRREDGKLISAIPFVEGTKEKPEPLPSGGNVQHDNVAVEFATEPATDGKDFVEKIRNAFKDVGYKVPEGHNLDVSPSANFEEDQLEHPESKRFGCDPDFDAWELAMNEPPECDNPNLRTCGGHVHVGKAEGDGNDFLLDPYGKITVVKLMDIFHGITSVILDSSPEAVERRKLYGKAGCHRPVSLEGDGLYDGVEYRVLSNFWFKSPDLVMLVHSLTEDVLNFIREGDYERLIEDIGEERIKDVINKGIVEDAHKVLEEFVRPLLSENSTYYLEYCMENMEKYDFKKEWKLEE